MINLLSASLIKGFLDGIMPVEKLLPSDWADKYRVLSSKASAEPGRWRTSRTPYLKEILDRFSPYDECKELGIMKGAQLGLTEAGFNVLGYQIMQDPCPIMYVMPTLDTIKRNSKMRISPMIESTPALSDRIKKSRKKDSGNSMFQKDFPGGTLILAGANSASSLRSVPVKLLILDEVDAYPLDLDKEGSPVDLAKARTRTFAKKKILYISTPVIHGQSVIERFYLDSSQRKFFVPCPHCNHYQHLEFENLIYTKNEDGSQAIDSKYKCCECSKLIEEHNKTDMLGKGEWRDTFPENANPEKIGYHINSLYSPLGWYSWLDAANEWLEAQKDQDKLKVFINTVLGETWMEKGEVPDWQSLMNRRSRYAINQPPAEVCLITVGVDVQKDRLELEIVGWCPGKVSYSIDYRVLPGDTGSREVWDELAKVVSESWVRTDDVIIPMARMAIDTGYNTAMVYDFCRRFHVTQVVPIKGQDRQAVIISQAKAVDYKRNKRKNSLKGLALYHVGVSILKQELYGWLKQSIGEDGVPDGYCYFPETYNEFFFKMLTAEQLTKKVVKGYTKYEWEQIRNRNEALDCRNYARAAASLVGIDKWNKEDWAVVAGSYDHRSEKTVKKKRKSSFWNK